MEDIVKNIAKMAVGITPSPWSYYLSVDDNTVFYRYNECDVGSSVYASDTLFGNPESAVRFFTRLHRTHPFSDVDYSVWEWVARVDPDNSPWDEDNVIAEGIEDEEMRSLVKMAVGIPGPWSYRLAMGGHYIVYSYKGADVGSVYTSHSKFGNPHTSVRYFNSLNRTHPFNLANYFSVWEWVDKVDPRMSPYADEDMNESIDDDEVKSLARLATQVSSPWSCSVSEPDADGLAYAWFRFNGELVASLQYSDTEISKGYHKIALESFKRRHHRFPFNPNRYTNAWVWLEACREREAINDQ